MRFTKYIICLTLVLFFTANTAGADDEEFKVKLAFKFRLGRTYVYSITSSRSVQADVPQPMFWQTDKQITKAVQRTAEATVSPGSQCPDISLI